MRWVAVDDCGPAINPMLIDGQVHGGIAHGIGQALYEQIVYDAEGQLVTGSFVDYALPTAAELPVVRDRPHRDPVAGQLARRQGHRRGGHDRRLAGRAERGGRRAAPARRRLHRHAADADAGLAGDRGGARPGLRPGRRPSRARELGEHGRAPPGSGPASPERRRWHRDPRASSTTTAPSRSTTRSAPLADGGEDAKLLAGGHSLLPLMKLRLAAPVAARRHLRARRAARGRAPQRQLAHRRAARATRSCRRATTSASSPARPR